MSNTAIDVAAVGAEIDRLHGLAMLHADTAVEHARKAGELLLKVKGELPHGEFLAWLKTNVSVTTRQAQRYMAAASGRPLPVRSIKCDTASHLSAESIRKMSYEEAGEYKVACLIEATVHMRAALADGPEKLVDSDRARAIDAVANCERMLSDMWDRMTDVFVLPAWATCSKTLQRLRDRLSKQPDAEKGI